VSRVYIIKGENRKDNYEQKRIIIVLFIWKIMAELQKSHNIKKYKVK